MHLGGQALARRDLAAGGEELVIGAPAEDVPAQGLQVGRKHVGLGVAGGQRQRQHPHTVPPSAEQRRRPDAHIRVGLWLAYLGPCLILRPS